MGEVTEQQSRADVRKICVKVSSNFLNSANGGMIFNKFLCTGLRF